MSAGLAGAAERADVAADAAVPVATDSAAEIVVGQNPIYRFAISEMEAGRYAAAIASIRKVVDAQPGNLGAWLDLAIAHCLDGDVNAAERVFLFIESRTEIPPAIAEVIDYYRTGACGGSRDRAEFFVSIGSGYSRNLNLGPTSSLVPIPELGVVLQLADSSLPRNSPFTQVEAGGIRALDDRGRWHASAYVHALAYRAAHDFDTLLAQATVIGRGESGALRTEFQGGYTYLRFGVLSGVNAISLSGSALHRLGASTAWGGSASFNLLDYTRLQTFNAQQFEVKGRFRWQPSSALRMTLDAGWHLDAATRDRPGGDRQGPVVQWRGTWTPSDRQSLDLSVRRAWLKETQPYNDLLFADTRRTPRLLQAQASWRFALQRETALRLDIRHASARDDIALFTYNSGSVALSLEWTPKR